MKTVTIIYTNGNKLNDKYENVTGLAYEEKFITIGQSNKTTKIPYVGISKIVEQG